MKYKNVADISTFYICPSPDFSTQHLVNNNTDTKQILPASTYAHNPHL